MPILPAILRVLLAGVFALAGIGKLRDPTGSRRSLADFGLPAALVAPLAVLLPLFELGLAVTLLPQATAVYAAFGAGAFLLVVEAVIAASLARGRRPNCHCFGQLHVKPIGWEVIARNAVLVGTAAFIAVAGWPNGGPSLVAWLTPLTPMERAVVAGGIPALALLGVQTALIVKLIRHLERLLSRLPAGEAFAPAAAPATTSQLTLPVAASRPVGSLAPAFALPGVDGELTTLDALKSLGKPAVLIFSDPECGPCNALIPDISAWQREHEASLTVVLISLGNSETHVDATREHPVKRLLLQRDREVAESYGVVGTPSAVLIQPDGTIGSPLAQGDTAVRELIGKAVQAARLEGLPEPPAPDSTWLDLDGQPATMAQFRGAPLFLLFWNPACGFCQLMLSDLNLWETGPGAGQLQTLIVSTGSAEANRALGLRSPIVLDSSFNAGRAYGVLGTPSGVLLDAQGDGAGEVLVGARAILARLGPAASPEDQLGVAEGIATESELSPLGSQPPADMETLPPGARPVKQACVQDELLADGVILYNSCRRQVLTVNGTGALVWECCDGEHDVDAIVAEISDVFPTPSGVHNDVRALLDQLLQAGMIAPGDAPNAETSAFAAG